MRARARETVHYEAIYRWHPLFAGEDFHVWSEGTANGPATTEGGDIHVIGNGALLIRMTPSTPASGCCRRTQAITSAEREQWDDGCNVLAVR